MFQSRRSKDLFTVWGVFGLCCALLLPAMAFFVRAAYDEASQVITGFAYLLIIVLTCCQVGSFCLGITLAFFKHDLGEAGVFKCSAYVYLGMVVVSVLATLVLLR